MGVNEREFWKAVYIASIGAGIRIPISHGHDESISRSAEILADRAVENCRNSINETDD